MYKHASFVAECSITTPSSPRLILTCSHSVTQQSSRVQSNCLIMMKEDVSTSVVNCVDSKLCCVSHTLRQLSMVITARSRQQQSSQAAAPAQLLATRVPTACPHNDQACTQKAAASPVTQPCHRPTLPTSHSHQGVGTKASLTQPLWRGFRHQTRHCLNTPATHDTKTSAVGQTQHGPTHHQVTTQRHPTMKKHGRSHHL